MEKIEIDKNKQLEPGDIIEMHFKTAGMFWLTAAQIALVEWKLEKRKDFRVINHSLPSANRVIFTIRVEQPPPGTPQIYKSGVGITAAVIGAVIIGAGVVAWLTLDKVYQIIESPAGKAVVGGTALSFAALAVIAILILLRK